MRAYTKTVTFDFQFNYSVNGKYEPATAITVCEPGFDHRDVFRRVSGYVASAQKGLLKMFAGQTREQIEDEVEAKAEKPEKDDADSIDSLVTMRMGLTIEEYEAFLKVVERALTGNKMLAYVGSDAENRVPVTEEVWRNISQTGGLGEMERVLEAFVGFFFDTRPGSKGPATANGTAKPSGPRATPGARSPLTKH